MKLIFFLVLIGEIISKNISKNIFLSIYENLILKYPKVEVNPEDFINHLSPDSENFNASMAINFINSYIRFISVYYTNLSN